MLTKTFPSGLARFVLTVILLLSLLGTQHIRPAAAQTLTVTNINDSGAGSLRQAVASAVAGDTITFAPALAGQTIVLATTIIINKNLTIDGSALSTPITISGVTTHDGTGNSQVFLIYFDVVATLKGLIITKSSVTGTTRSGGINIYNNATLTIIDCTITNNSDSGILNWYGTLIMQDSIVSDNSAISGGGI